MEFRDESCYENVTFRGRIKYKVNFSGNVSLIAILYIVMMRPSVNDNG